MMSAVKETKIGSVSMKADTKLSLYPNHYVELYTIDNFVNIVNIF